MIGIVEACERYFYDELLNLQSYGFYFRSKGLSKIIKTPFERFGKNGLGHK